MWFKVLFVVMVEGGFDQSEFPYWGIIPYSQVHDH